MISKEKIPVLLYADFMRGINLKRQQGEAVDPGEVPAVQGGYREAQRNRGCGDYQVMGSDFDALLALGRP
jgi:hypothetical protein